MNKFNKGISTLLVVIIAGVVVLVGGGLIYYYIIRTQSVNPTQQPQNQQQNTQNQVDKTAGWKVFSDKEVGYSLKYPAELQTQQVVENGLKEKITRIILPIALAAGLPANTWGFKSDYLVFDIRREKIAEAVGPAWGAPDYKEYRDYLQNDMETLARGEFNNKPYFGSLGIKSSWKVTQIDGGIYAKTYTGLKGFGVADICDFLPTREFVFYKNGYRVDIGLQAWDAGKTQSELPQYFTTDVENCGSTPVLKDNSGFYEDLAGGRISAETEAGIWYNTFDTIISTVEFLN